MAHALSFKIHMLQCRSRHCESCHLKLKRFIELTQQIMLTTQLFSSCITAFITRHSMYCRLEANISGDWVPCIYNEKKFHINVSKNCNYEKVIQNEMEICFPNFNIQVQFEQSNFSSSWKIEVQYKPTWFSLTAIRFS